MREANTLHLARIRPLLSLRIIGFEAKLIRQGAKSSLLLHCCNTFDPNHTGGGGDRL
jgi:hypothetical protein